MSWLGDVWKFEKLKMKDMAKKLRENPERALIGGMDTFGTKMWNKILNKDWEPLVSPMGGATKGDYRRAEEAGINTGPGRTMHNIAGSIAGMYAGGYGMEQLGLGGAGGGGSEGGFQMPSFSMPQQQQQVPQRSGMTMALQQQQAMADMLRKNQEDATWAKDPTGAAS